MVPLILVRIPAPDGSERSRASLDPAGLLLATGGAPGIVWALIRADGLGLTMVAGALTWIALIARTGPPYWDSWPASAPPWPPAPAWPCSARPLA